LQINYTKQFENPRKRSSSIYEDLVCKRLSSFNKEENKSESSFSKSENEHSENEQIDNQMVNRHLLEENDDDSDNEADNFYNLYRKISNLNDNSPKSLVNKKY
jgi:hypothetical protein